MFEFAGDVATGALLTLTVTVVIDVSAAPQASVTIKVRTLAPAIGVKQTVSPERVPPETVTDVKFPSASLVVNPGKQIWLKSHTK